MAPGFLEVAQHQLVFKSSMASTCFFLAVYPSDMAEFQIYLTHKTLEPYIK